jgi:cation transport ATPase
VVEPWFGAERSAPRQEGEVLLAGGRLLEGSVRAVVRWAGMDRAWARLTVDPQRRGDRQSQLARLAERVTSSGALGFAAAGALIAVGGQVPRVLVLSAAAAMAAVLASSGLEELMSVHIARGVLRLLAHGISFRSPGAFDRTARVSGALFCAEGTLLRGELGVTSVEATGQLHADELVSLLAGAHAGTSSPLASALQRAAQERRVRPDAARSRSYTPGLGVTAITSTGQSLVAGTRSLLLERRISVANAEPRIADIEASGQSALLVALDGRSVGLLALQDGFAEGARAAVRRTLEARVEPILLSSETRDTCQALARQLGIEHVRPEVLPRDRAEEVRRVSQLRGSIAVVGRSSNDDAALGAAALSINLDPRGGPIERWDVDIASGAIEDAALALQLAAWLHTRGRRALQLTAVPALLALLSLALGAPLQVLPLWGAVASLLLARQLGTAHPPDPSTRD